MFFSSSLQTFSDKFIDAVKIDSIFYVFLSAILVAFVVCCAVFFASPDFKFASNARKAVRSTSIGEKEYYISLMPKNIVAGYKLAKKHKNGHMVLKSECVHTNFVSSIIFALFGIVLFIPLFLFEQKLLANDNYSVTFLYSIIFAALCVLVIIKDAIAKLIVSRRFLSFYENIILEINGSVFSTKSNDGYNVDKYSDTIELQNEYLNTVDLGLDEREKNNDVEKEDQLEQTIDYTHFSAKDKKNQENLEKKIKQNEKNKANVKTVKIQNTQTANVEDDVYKDMQVAEDMDFSNQAVEDEIEIDKILSKDKENYQKPQYNDFDGSLKKTLDTKLVEDTVKEIEAAKERKAEKDSVIFIDNNIKKEPVSQENYLNIETESDNIEDFEDSFGGDYQNNNSTEQVYSMAELKTGEDSDFINQDAKSTQKFSNVFSTNKNDIENKIKVASVKQDKSYISKDKIIENDNSINDNDFIDVNYQPHSAEHDEIEQKIQAALHSQPDFNLKGLSADEIFKKVEVMSQKGASITELKEAASVLQEERIKPQNSTQDNQYKLNAALLLLLTALKNANKK